jgi:hypothetical protein
MRIREIKLMEQILNQMKNRDVNIWLHGIVVTPVLLFEDFDWDYEDHEDDDSLLILYNGENKILINKDEIYTIMGDELLNEVVIFMNNESLLQIWCDL